MPDAVPEFIAAVCVGFGLRGGGVVAVSGGCVRGGMGVRRRLVGRALGEGEIKAREAWNCGGRVRRRGIVVFGFVV